MPLICFIPRPKMHNTSNLITLPEELLKFYFFETVLSIWPVEIQMFWVLAL